MYKIILIYFIELIVKNNLTFLKPSTSYCTNYMEVVHVLNFFDCILISKKIYKPYNIYYIIFHQIFITPRSFSKNPFNVIVL